jgi:hypothetical protein
LALCGRIIQKYVAKKWDSVVSCYPMPTRVFQKSVLFFVSLYSVAAVSAQNVEVGKVALASTDNKFLQAHADIGDTGELHASNPKINQEETWFMYRVGDANNHQVALANYRNHYYIQRHSGGATNHRAEATAHDIGGESTWTMISGKDYGLAADIVAFRAYDGSFLKAYNEGRNADGERGEVYVDMSGPLRDGAWNGWWRMGEVTWDPQPGRSFWTVMGDGINWFAYRLDDVLSWAFGGAGASTSGTGKPGSTESCSNLPPVPAATTTRWVHAYCLGVVPTDYPGKFYPENDLKKNTRVECDMIEHHKTEPTHYMENQACNEGFHEGAGCEPINNMIVAATQPTTPAPPGATKPVPPVEPPLPASQKNVFQKFGHWIANVFKGFGHLFTR